MSASQVLLGLLPTLLSSLGSNPQETGTLAIIGRRPLLALLLALASPTISIVPVAEYSRTIKALHVHRLSCKLWFRNLDKAIMVFEYIVALVALGNLAELAYRIGAQTISVIFPTDAWMLTMWMELGLTIYMLGALCIRLCAKVTHREYLDKAHDRAVKNGHQHPSELASAFLKWSISRYSRAVVQLGTLGLGFYAAAWFTSVYSGCYITFGTMLFASTILISVDDSIFLGVRLLGSVAATRLIVSYELAVTGGRVVLENQPTEERELQTLGQALLSLWHN